MASSTALGTALVRTAAYFSLFRYPLTPTELWQWLWWEGSSAPSLAEVTFELEENTALQRVLRHEQGFYYVTDDAGCVAERAARYRASLGKLRRARRFAGWLARLPGVVGVAACNSLGYQNARRQSDIDFFVVVRPGMLWLARLGAVGLSRFFGARPSAAHSADTLCLSFFISTDGLNLASLALVGGDPYLTYWVTQLTPLYDRGGVWQRFWEANAWVRRSLPNAIGYGAPVKGIPVANQPASRGTMLADNLAERFQRRRLPNVITIAAAVEQSAVLLSRTTLKFHTNDRRVWYREAWAKRVAAVYDAV